LLVAAIDNGYSYLKARSRDCDLTQPACVDVAKVLSAPIPRPGNAPPDIMVKDDDQMWMVGNMAARQSTTPRFSSDPDRAHDPVFRRLLKAGLMVLGDGMQDAECALVTGLPPEQQADEATRKAFTDSLMGDYVLSGQINDRHVNQKLHVFEVKALPQYFGTYYDLVSDAAGVPMRDLLDKPLVRGRKVFVDIGGGTVDIGGMDGLDPVYPMTLSLPKAMNWVYAEARKQHMNLGLAMVEREARAGRMDVNRPMAELAGMIADELRGVLQRTGFSPELYIITGGAARLLRPYLELPGEVITCGQGSNVDGYLKFGLRRHANR
jgi:hypothetical protein